MRFSLITEEQLDPMDGLVSQDDLNYIYQERISSEQPAQGLYGWPFGGRELPIIGSSYGRM